jgi:hypothetical protein
MMVNAESAMISGVRSCKPIWIASWTSTTASALIADIAPRDALRSRPFGRFDSALTARLLDVD